MSDPTYAPTLAGDWHDDDGIVISSMLDESNAPPDPMESLGIVVAHDEAPPRVTRLLSGTVSLAPGDMPVQLLPPDPGRISLSIRANGAGATDYAVYADENQKVQYLGTSSLGARLLVTKEQGLDSHTGAVWVAVPAGNSAVVYVSYVAVIK